MKHLYILILVLFSGMNLSAQQFSLPADGKWYLVAKVGGLHSEFEYTYKHTTAHKPSLVSGRIQFTIHRIFLFRSIIVWVMQHGCNRSSHY